MIANFLHSMIVCPDMDFSYNRITHGEGVFLYDQNKKKYLDGSSGSTAVANLGYGNTEIANIIKEQVNKVPVLPTHFFSSYESEKYYSKLVEYSGSSYGKCWTIMNGTDAVENALKVALQYHQITGNASKYKIISRWYSYHGNSIFTLDIGGMMYRRKAYNQWLNNFPHINPAYFYRYGIGCTENEFTDICINEFLKCIEDNDPATIAAFIAEPVVGAALGAVPPPHGYFEKIYEICQEHNILFIADEVMTGFGRLGENFGMQRFNVAPDIIAYGKGISGGYFPLSAIVVSDKISEAFEISRLPFLGGHTFACNPVGAVVGSYVIDYMKDNEINSHVKILESLINERFKDLLNVEIVGDIRGRGLLWGVEFVSNKKSKQPFPREMQISKKIGQLALDEGLIVYPGGGSFDGQLGDHILIAPPLIIDEVQMNLLIDILFKVIIQYNVTI